MFPNRPTLRARRESMFSFLPSVLRPCRALAVVALGASLGAPLATAQVTVQSALQFVPVQKDVSYDTPAAKDLKGCSVKAEQIGGIPAWVVRGAAKQILRTFNDTNKDNKVDQWCYYQNGIESYRDVDTDFNGKADQHRWVGMAGTKWGVDKNEDGNIDNWNVISAEEVTAELVAAVRDGDVNRLNTVLLKPAELAELGLGEEAAKKIAGRLSTAAQRFQAGVRAQKLVGRDSKWVHFSASKPALLPAGSTGATKDVYVYENVAAMLDKGQLPIGTLVRVNGQWRAIDVPMGLMPEAERNDFGSFLLTPSIAAPDVPVGPGIDKEVQKLVTEMQKNDGAIRATQNQASRDKLYDRQVAILTELTQKAAADGDKEDQQMWIRQLAETLGASIQSGEYTKGREELTKLQTTLERQAPGQPLTGFVRYRLLNADYAERLRNPKANFPKVQDWWIESLTAFVKAYPKGSDFTEAMLQLAIAEELAGNDKVAVENYEAIIRNGEGEMEIAKAKGSVTRLQSVGKALRYSGASLANPAQKVDLAQYRNKYVLLHFWATWSQPSVDEMATIARMRAFYGKDFEAIGVNVDTDATALKGFLAQNPQVAKWQHIYEKGGFDGKPATDLGILTVPTMMLINPRNEVVYRNTDVADAQKYLDKKLNPAKAAVRPGTRPGA